MYGERMLGRALRRRSRRASGLAAVESGARVERHLRDANVGS